jgi:mRNA interferase MazF
MGAPARGEVVLVNFPFTDLSGRKLRPAVVLAAGDYHNDIILCQITSQAYGDREAVSIDPVNDFDQGTLAKPSFARPRKLFTANERLVSRVIGTLKTARLEAIAQAVTSAIAGR